MSITAMIPVTIEQAQTMAETLAKSSLIPPELRGKPADVFVTLLAGHELGLGPMQSLRSIYVVKGKPVMSADLMVALVARQTDVCKYFRLCESTTTRAVYETLRAGHPEPTRMEWTIEAAKVAGLTANPTWQKHAAAMLRARCSAALARAVYPDLVLGVYETSEGEEIADSRPAHAPVDVLPAGIAPPQAFPPLQPRKDAPARVVDVPVADTPEEQPFSAEEVLSIMIEEAPDEASLLSLKGQLETFCGADKDHPLRLKARARLRTMRGAA